GGVAYRKGQYETARTELSAVVAVFERFKAYEELGIAENTLGAVADVTRQRDDANAHYTRAIAAFDSAGDRRNKASATLNLLRASDVLAPDRFGRLAALRQDAAVLGFRDLEGSVLHIWGDDLFGRGDFAGAVEKLDEAVAVFEAGPTSDPLELGTVYTSLGRIFRLHGQTTVALQYQLKALALHEKMGPSIQLVQSLNAVAVTLADLRRYKDAEVYYERALALADTIAPPATRSFLRANYGAFLTKSDDGLARGRALLIEALPDTTAAQKALRYMELAQIDLQLNRIADAAAEADEAVASCSFALTQVDCARARLTRARVHLARGDEAAALADHEAALKTVESLHAQLAADDFLKQGFDQLWAPAYSLAIELHFRRGEVREALEDAERARSRALLDLLASRDLHPDQPRPASSMTTRGTRVASIRSDAAAESATTADLVATAARLHSSLVLYWVADDRIYEWVIAPNGALSSASVAVPRAKLEDLIRATTAFADDASRGPAAKTRGEQSISLVVKPQTAWRDLYDLLILPVARDLPSTPGARLTIVPHGPLINVPFAALRDAQGRYLVERYAVHSVTAGAMLEYTRAGGANPRSGPVLLVADPAQPPKIPGDPPLPRLPGANAEVRAIARLLPAAQTTVLSDTAATEPRVLAAVPHQTVLHFATHAIVRDADPLSSFLALGRPADGSASGQLTADKIYGLSLEANLVVLSACRSGEGVPTGDGIAALARAFFYAGSSSLIVSLWDIADQPTNRLLPAFYREWLKGADKARALRAAQLQLIADLRAGRVKVSTALGDVVVPEDPAFWAAFILLGDPD
ncbi:MAG: CHAT domain-containing protein, partial [Vicinamibacterales bacterium]